MTHPPTDRTAPDHNEQNVEVVTLGCRLNTYESQIIRQNAESAGWKNTIIINTCAVTQEAERQARQAIRKMRRNKPHHRIIVTGCAAQIHPESWSNMPEVNRVMGNREKLDPRFYNENQWDHHKIQVQDIMALQETAPQWVDDFEGRARAFVQIQQGCDHRCTFCIIPLGRGPSQSVPAGVIVQNIQQLVQKGYQDIALTGVDITSYGQDLPGKPSLGLLVKRILRLVPELPRLRLSSVDPAEMDEDLYDAFAEESRLMPYIHLSLQAGDDLILKRMKRRHLRHHVFELTRRLRNIRPDVVFGADVIAGFPTENEAMFDRTTELIRSTNIVHLHVFPYSPRPMTPAARMPQIHGTAIKKRAAILRNVGHENLIQYLKSQIGQTLPVLIEKDQQGKTPGHATVLIKASPNDIEVGKIFPVFIQAINETDQPHLIGQLTSTNH